MSSSGLVLLDVAVSVADGLLFDALLVVNVLAAWTNSQ